MLRWSEPTGGEIDRAIASKEFSGKLYRRSSPQLSMADIGRDALPRLDLARRAISRRSCAPGGDGNRLTARQKKIGRVAFLCQGALDTPEMIQALAEGLTLGSSRPGTIRPRATSHLADGAQHHRRGADAGRPRRRPHRGRVIGEHCNMARQLDNEPGNALTPSVFAERLCADSARRRADGGRARSSGARAARHGHAARCRPRQSEPPRLVAIRSDPAGAPASPVLVWSAKASRSTRAASQSSPRPTWIG